MTSTKSSVHLAPISAVYAFNRAVEKLSTLRQKIRKEKTLRELVERAGKAKGCSLRRPIIGTKYDYTACSSACACFGLAWE